MKKALLLLTLVCLPLVASALVNEDDITMVSYEQSYLDAQGKLVLKNNSEQDVHKVSFKMTYLDMSDKTLDNKVFDLAVDIAPGMTQELEIPAYGHDRYYHYYETKDKFGNPAFKIKFELKGYNHEVVAAADEEADALEASEDGEGNEKDSDSLLLYGLVMLGFFVLAGYMAKKRNRSVALWLLLSLFVSPFIVCAILLVLGDDD